MLALKLAWPNVTIITTFYHLLLHFSLSVTDVFAVNFLWSLWGNYSFLVFVFALMSSSFDFTVNHSFPYLNVIFLTFNPFTSSITTSLSLTALYKVCVETTVPYCHVFYSKQTPSNIMLSMNHGRAMLKTCLFPW